MHLTTSPHADAAPDWHAQWIRHPGPAMLNWKAPVLPSPLLRREFTLWAPASQARLFICGLGFFEARLNGCKVGDDVLVPTVTQYDKRVRYLDYEVTNQLQEGANAIGVMLGNGWYNSHTEDVWHFDKASWRDYPKLLLQLEVHYADGSHETLISDSGWVTAEGPIVFDGLRNGERYDARRERDGWDQPGFDSTGWSNAQICAGPGGLLEPQLAPPCKVMQTIDAVSVTTIGEGVHIFDFGQNIAGWARLSVDADAGTRITLRYAEKLANDGDIDQSNINEYVLCGPFQTDEYCTKGNGTESWEPRFTYHGFRYVQLTGLDATPDIDTLKARFVHTAFRQTTELRSGNRTLMGLYDCGIRSFKSNFVGIPTDCPHREKNGWTGDAWLAAETGLAYFDCAVAYEEWLDTLADTQRPNGQLPGIAPSVGWGFNWGNGPAWDSALILIPHYIYRRTGRTQAIEKLFDNMLRYVDFCESMASDGILDFGLGDWQHPEPSDMAPVAFISSAFHYQNLCILAEFSDLIHRGQATRLKQRASSTRDAIQVRFFASPDDDILHNPTGMAIAVAFGLVDGELQTTIVNRLVAEFASDPTARFGVLGAKYVPRVLVDHGYAKTAVRLLEHTTYPGWGYWLKQGASTLRERWDEDGSMNHAYLSDPLDWLQRIDT